MVDGKRRPRALRIGGDAFRYLAGQPRAGRLVSRFHCGFKLLLDEDTDPGFVAIQASEVPPHPWGV